VEFREGKERKEKGKGGGHAGLKRKKKTPNGAMGLKQTEGGGKKKTLAVEGKGEKKKKLGETLKEKSGEREGKLWGTT